MFDDCFRVFNLFSLFSFTIVSGDRARFKKTPKSWWKREKHKCWVRKRTPRLTHTIFSLPATRIVQSHAVHVSVSFSPLCGARQRTRQKHNLLVLYGLRIDWNAVDGFSFLSFLMTFGGASWRNCRFVYSNFFRINVISRRNWADIFDFFRNLSRMKNFKLLKTVMSKRKVRNLSDHWKIMKKIKLR